MLRHLVLFTILLLVWMYAEEAGCIIKKDKIKEIIERSSRLKKPKTGRVKKSRPDARGQSMHNEYAHGYAGKTTPAIRPLHIKPVTEIVQIEPMTIEKYKALQREREAKRKEAQAAMLSAKEKRNRKSGEKPFASLPALPPGTIAEEALKKRFEKREERERREAPTAHTKQNAVPSYF